MAARGAALWTRACPLLLLATCLSRAAGDAGASGRGYYETLNVEPSATASQIKKAFRGLAVKYHPDKNRSAGAEKTFREITEAYKVLSNKESRRLYDRLGHEAFLNNEASSEPADEAGFPFGFSDLFRDLDDGPFDEEPHFHWGSHQEAVGEQDEGSYTFEAQGFSFYFWDGDESEDEYLYL